MPIEHHCAGRAHIRARPAARAARHNSVYGAPRRLKGIPRAHTNAPAAADAFTRQVTDLAEG